MKSIVLVLTLLPGFINACLSGGSTTGSRQRSSSTQEQQQSGQKNIYNAPLATCSTDPMTGWFRDGLCRTDDRDRGVHTVCATMTQGVRLNLHAHLELVEICEIRHSYNMLVQC